VAEFIKDLTWTRRTFPPRGARGMPATLDEIVSPTVDILGSLRFEEVDFDLVLGTVALTSVEGQLVPSTEVWLVLGLDVMHNDPAARRITIMILNKTGTLTVGLPTDNSAQLLVNSNVRINCTLNRFYLGPGERLRGEANAIAAGTRLSLRYRWIPLPLGELVRI